MELCVEQILSLMGLNVFSLLFGFSTLLADSLTAKQPVLLSTGQQVSECVCVCVLHLGPFYMHGVYSMNLSLSCGFPLACRFIRRQSKFHNFHCEVFFGINICPARILERPPALQHPSHSGLQSRLTGQ